MHSGFFGVKLRIDKLGVKLEHFSKKFDYCNDVCGVIGIFCIIYEKQIEKILVKLEYFSKKFDYFYLTLKYQKFVCKFQDKSSHISNTSPK